MTGRDKKNRPAERKKPPRASRTAASRGKLEEADELPEEPAEPKEAGPHRAGFLALVGRPNVGKSTLLNQLVGQKLAIVSPKPQTTRRRILGVVTRPDAQFALLDTPGLHAARGGLNANMVRTALQTLADADVALFLVEASAEGIGIDTATREALAQVKKARKPTLLVINKIDLVDKPMLLPLIDRWQREHDWTAIYPLSALKGENLAGFLDELARHLPEGPQLFDPEMWTDATERELCGELVREQVLRQTTQEVPYSCAVQVEEFDETERETGARGLVRVSAVLNVERDSQKSIVIGKQGARLKEIGTKARLEMERLLGCKVFLQLHVRVEPRWTESERGLRKVGIES